MNTDDFVIDLLHIDDVGQNRLIDVTGDKTKTYYLSHPLNFDDDFVTYLTKVAKDRYGKVGNTVLRNSALSLEQIVGLNVNYLDWQTADGTKDPKKFDAYITNVYKELRLKGNNPLFLGIGGLRWVITAAKDEVKKILSPILVYPIRLIRGGTNNPVAIEFVGSDVYVNPCLVAKLEQVWGAEVAKGFPHPNGRDVDLDEPVDLNKLGDGKEYFAAVREYLRRCARGDSEGNTVFAYEPVGVISQYNHDELCMYYDIRRNREKIDNHPIIRCIFNKDETALPPATGKSAPQLILPRDSVQEKIIRRVVNGESLIIKGPPGTGKTLTIANMIAALLAENKKVLLASQKLAALSEVYAKLPEKIRKFVMLLDCETEAQAAKLDPANVKRSLNELLRNRRSFEKDNKIYDRLTEVRKERDEGVMFLSDYVEMAFKGEEVVGGSYYEALDKYCKKNLNVIRFADAQQVRSLTREEYAQLSDLVKEAGRQFDFLTDEGKNSLVKSPWYPLAADGLGENVEELVSRYKDLSTEAEEVYESASLLLEKYGITVKETGIENFIRLTRSELTEAQMQAVISAELKAEDVKELSEALKEYQKSKDDTLLSAFVFENEKDAEEYLEKAEAIKSDGNLTITEFFDIYENRELLSLLNKDENIRRAVELTETIVACEEKYSALEEKLYGVFRRDLSKEELELILKSHEALAKYVEQSEKKEPGMLDFAAKKAYKNLAPLSYLKDVSFREIVDGTQVFADMEATTKEKEDTMSLMSRLFRREMSKESVAKVISFVGKCAEANIRPNDYLTIVANDFDRVKLCMEKAKPAFEGTYTLGRLQGAYFAHAAANRMLEKTNGFIEKYALTLETEKKTAEGIASSLLATYAFSRYTGTKYTSALELATALIKLKDEGRALAKRSEKLLDAFYETGAEFFLTYYSYCQNLITFGDLTQFIEQAKDRNKLNAMEQYLAAVYAPKAPLELENFFRPFEKNPAIRQLATFEDFFEHSVYALAIAVHAAILGKYRNGLGNNVKDSIEKWLRGTKNTDEVNVDYIENMCMDRIPTEDSEYAFLNSERTSLGSLRLLFKQNASALMKLKKCFLLSPYTVSVLFGREEFFEFDVLIMDEASQLTPTAALPALFRAKQCVLVGDEYQMPPIKHFASQTERTVTGSDGETYTLQSELSVLALALQCGKIPTEKLACHYRSQTESLIAFSQKRYYPGMRTFPCVNPVQEGFGLVDVYVPNGCVEKGVNVAEAQEVIRCLEKHFERYYNERTGVLSASVGVVAFGQKQLNQIIDSIPSALRAKIKHAEATFDDPLKEKLIFFKTIETVQGQETEHLILSLTYGKTAGGAIHQRFGELNNGDLGQCIFNVAVTRAQASVTVVHSVLAEDITNDNISFIKEYLEFVQRFGSPDKEQFVCEEPKAGFLRSVGEFIISCGFARDRVVYNYGVTADSVRIPIAVLSEDKTRALLGVWCEKPLEGGVHYLDYNARYFSSLRDRGWKLYRVYAHDWVDNEEMEKEALRAELEKIKI